MIDGKSLVIYGSTVMRNILLFGRAMISVLGRINIYTRERMIFLDFCVKNSAIILLLG